MKMQMSGSLLLSTSMIAGSVAQSGPIPVDHICARGYDDFRFANEFRRDCGHGCSKQSCDSAAAKDKRGIQCYTAAQIGKDGSLIVHGDTPRGCNKGTDDNTCAMVEGKCVYSDFQGDSPPKPRKVLISYSGEKQATGLAATSNSSEGNTFRLILAEEEGKQHLRLVEVDSNDTPTDPQYQKYGKKEQAWYQSEGGIFSYDMTFCLELSTAGCKGGPNEYCLRSLNEAGNSCTTYNNPTKDGRGIWKFRQPTVRIHDSADLCMGDPANPGNEGKSFKKLHASSVAANCNDKWKFEMFTKPRHSNELEHDLQTTTTTHWTCDSCKTKWPKTHPESDGWPKVDHFLCATADGCIPSPDESTCTGLPSGTWCAKPATPLCMDDGTGKPLHWIAGNDCKDGCKATVCQKKMDQTDDEGHPKAHNTCLTATGQPGCNYDWKGSNEHTCVVDDSSGKCVYAVIQSTVTV